MARVERGQSPHFDKYVARTMRCLPDKFIELCHRHLAVVLDLSGDKLELLLSGNEEHQKRRFGLPSVGMFKKKDKSHGLFGGPLTDEGVRLMLPLINFLKVEINVSKEGLFRKPGIKSRMTTLKELLIAHGPTISIDPEVFSANDVASVLKEFVRELPEPLLTERHLEAHRQILALGQNARTPEEIARYSSRKLSAIQLLMLLLPSPTQKLTMHLVQLLRKTADSPKSKMTAATLGTIFAPIFFIHKKVQPIDMCRQIASTAPAVSFMIDKAHELFQPPKELVIDLAKCWRSMGQALLHSKNRESGQMQQLPSGQTVSTDADLEVSKCEDVASKTQAELSNLLARVQTVPNSSHSAKLKAQIMKTIDTPEFCGGLRSRSKSFGASLRKRLPSLGRLMNKQGDTPGSSASSSSSSDSKTETSSRTRLFESPAHTFEAGRSLRVPRPGHKRHVSENCPTTVPQRDPTSSNTLVKQKCKDATTCRTTLTVTVDQKPPNAAGCKTLLTACRTSVTVTVDQKPPKGAGCKTLPNVNKTFANVVSDFGKNCCPRGLSLTSDLEKPATYDIENKNPATYEIENTDPISQISVRVIGKTDPVSNTLQQQLGAVHTGAPVSLAKSETSSVHLNKAGCFQSETRIDYLPHVAIKKITLSVTSSGNSSPVINTRQQSSRKPGTQVKTHAVLRVIQGKLLETAL